jgi:MscS family membrane protein
MLKRAAVVGLLAWSLGVPVAMAQDEAPASEEPVAGLPAEVDEAQGTCKTPRQAWMQLLYWMQSERRDPKRAAICFDRSRINDKQAATLAGQLYEVLDANGWYILPNELPTSPDYTNAAGHSTYVDPAVTGKGIEVFKRRGKWLFTPDTLERVPELYPGFVARVVSILPGFFHDRAFGVEMWKFLGIVVLVFIALLVQRLVVFFIRTYLRRLVSKTNLSYLDQAVAKADRPIGGLVMAAVFFIGLPQLLFPVGIAKVAMVATEALAAYSMVWFGYRLIDVLRIWMTARAEKSDTKLDDQLVPLITKTLKVFVSVIGGIFVLQNLNVDVSSLIAGLGIGGLAFAFAAKDTIANFFGSVAIFLDKPFQIGDWIAMSSVEGIVEEVGFRTTKVRTFYNSLVTVPNMLVTGETIDNYGARKYRRYTTTLGLAYDTPPAKVQAFCEALRGAIKRMPLMRRDYYLVEFKEFADFSLNIMVYCFMETDSWNDELRARTNLNLEILRIAENLGISFAFPTQTLHIDSMAKSGESKASHSGPSENKEIIEVVNGFGPRGKLAMQEGYELTRGFYCGDDFDPETTAGRGGDG